MHSPVEFANVLAGITDPVLMRKFIREILTPKEIDDFALRWQLVKELYRGDTQRTIAARHHISLCKITRGSKILKKKNSITRSILDNMMRNEEENKS
jgi:TrpR family trp operon transcriptional repressor